MKTFIIVMETAFIAFMAGAVVGMKLAEESDRPNDECSEEETPA